MENRYYNRTADNSIYLNGDRYTPPKEIFKQAAQLLQLSELSEKHKLIDVGGATGEFLYYVRTINPNIGLHCAEYSTEMVRRSKKFLNDYNISIEVDDANRLKFDSDKFDIVTTIGVISIFDDFKPSFEEMIRVCKSGGKCLNTMMLNEMPIDVIIKYINPTTGSLEAGWNKFSIKSISQFLDAHPNVKKFKFVKHVMPLDIPKREDDLMRSWTVINQNGERILWNGLNMEISIYHILFEIEK